MLSEIYIRNFAIIDELRISFDRGLNVISGETGAGKSIIIGAISLLLGDRASADMIRSSEESADVEASFNIEGMGALQERLAEAGYRGGDELIIKRTISRSGKNRVYINGSMASLTALTSLCEPLVNICSQHEHQMMLNRENHIDILDSFGALYPLREEYGELYGRYNALAIRLRELESLRERMKAEEELHRFQFDEIVMADIKAGEDESLQEEKRVLSNARKLSEFADAAYDKLYGQQGSVLEELRRAMAMVDEIKKIDGSLPLEGQETEEIYYHLEDVAMRLRNYRKNIVFDPARMNLLEERLELLALLKRKYGGTLAAVLDRKAALEKDIGDITGLDCEVAKAAEDLRHCRLSLKEKAERLTERRRDAAARLKDSLEEEIHTLKMDGASFAVRFNHSGEGESAFKPKGADDVEFFLSTNSGEELKPLARIASGGELSRIILAMKKALAGTGPLGTMVFDEVDSGIGGAVAEIVGKKLKEAAGRYQVLCITHLPQIACFADRHYLVAKEDMKDRTATSIRFLSEEERLEEITRMLAGLEMTEKAREHAREMLMASRRQV